MGGRNATSEESKMNIVEFNGWTNYATWRVNLELCEPISKDCLENDFLDIHEIAIFLKEYCIDAIDACSTSIARNYANAFLADVDFVQIATRIMEQ